MTETETNTAEAAYEGWAIVELMGRRKIAGQVREVTQYGVTQLRIDVPNPNIDGVEIIATQFYSGSALYGVTPCDEATARRTLEAKWELPEPVRLAISDQTKKDKPELDFDHDDFDEDEDYG